MKRRLLFVVAILTSAFLIFLVQPMVGKRILPWFGGSPGVWTLCLAFYQTTLFLGYAYAHLLIRFATPKSQLVIHSVLVAAAFAVLPVLPGNLWQPAGGDNPSVDILVMLAANVALPFLVLASTGPLVQAWFARAYPDRSPYPLYAVSNFGSFAALLAYPFVFEPWLSLSKTGTAWSYAFAFTGLAVLACAALSRPATSSLTTAVADAGDEMASHPIRAEQVVLWILLAGCAVILLMGVTNSVCLDVASVPFLWVLPLATYLLTFILCFASERVYHRTPYIAVALVAGLLTQGQPLIEEWGGQRIAGLVNAIYVQVPAYCAMLFGACMVLHGELYRLRPPPRSLTAFYLCVSGGGALGGMFVGLLAPVIFDEYYEVKVGLGLALVLFGWVGALGARRSDPSGTAVWRWAIGAPIACLLALYALWPRNDFEKDLIYRERGFFGVLRVLDLNETGVPQRHLISGSTLHGLQFLLPAHRHLPSVYYGRATGIGMVMAERPDDVPSKIGLVGLGVGTLTAYGRKGDSFHYYEIDPTVVNIARDSGLFTFLKSSPADVDIVLGDGRLSLAREQAEHGSQQFDYLVLDAFNSDAIPVHLLTLEAFRIYAAALAPNGLLAVHVSNRHFNLLPLVARTGKEVGLDAILVGTNVAPKLQSHIAHWVFLSRDRKRLDDLANFVRERVQELGLPFKHAQVKRMTQEAMDEAPMWTDDYSNLLSVIRPKTLKGK